MTTTTTKTEPERVELPGGWAGADSETRLSILAKIVDDLWLCEGGSDGDHAEIVRGWPEVVRHYARHALDWEAPQSALTEAAQTLRVFPEDRWSFGHNGTASYRENFEDGWISYTRVTAAPGLASALRSSAAAGVPATHVVVPREPTERMLKAVSHYDREWGFWLIGRTDAKAIYGEMLAASPEPPAPKAAGEAVAWRDQEGFLWPEQDWRCPRCGTRSYCHIHERKEGGDFGPGPDVRCVHCKDVFSPPAASPEPPAPRAEGEAVAYMVDCVRDGTRLWSASHREEADYHARSIGFQAAEPLYTATPRPAATNAEVEGLVKTFEDAVSILWRLRDASSAIARDAARAAIFSAFATLRAENARLSAELDALRQGGAGVNAELRKAFERLKRVVDGNVGFPECVEAERYFVLTAYSVTEKALAALDARPASDLTKGGDRG